MAEVLKNSLKKKKESNFEPRLCPIILFSIGYVLSNPFNPSLRRIEYELKRNRSSHQSSIIATLMGTDIRKKRRPSERKRERDRQMYIYREREGERIGFPVASNQIRQRLQHPATDCLINCINLGAQGQRGGHDPTNEANS